jgi:hypothetical protein
MSPKCQGKTLSAASNDQSSEKAPPSCVFLSFRVRSLFVFLNRLVGGRSLRRIGPILLWQKLDELPDRLADIFRRIHHLERLYLIDESSNDPTHASHAVLIQTKRRPEDEKAHMADEIKAKCGDPLLVVTWKLVEEHIRQVMKERMTRDTSSDRSWTRVIPETRIGRIFCRESLWKHTWTSGCYCEYCQRWEERHPGSSSSLVRLS